MHHPNFLDRFFLKLNPRYLYSKQVSVLVGQINVGIFHKVMAEKPQWKIMDFVYLEKGSLLRYYGLAKKLKINGDIEPMYSIFEVVKPVPKPGLEAKHVSAGDLICVTPVDRKFIYPSQEIPQNTLLPARPQ